MRRFSSALSVERGVMAREKPRCRRVRLTIWTDVGPDLETLGPATSYDTESQRLAIAVWTRAHHGADDETSRR